jgi:DNA-binding MarR family transcriptional regulator
MTAKVIRAVPRHHRPVAGSLTLQLSSGDLAGVFADRQHMQLRILCAFARISAAMTAPAPTTSAAELGDELLELLAHAIRGQQHRVFRAAADLDLSLAQLQGLCVLGVGERPLALHELCDHMGLSVGATSRAVDALYRDGYVTRREDETDRRVKRIAITAAGRDVIARLDEARRAGLHAFAATLTDDERDGLSRALAPVLARLGEP